MFIKRTSYLLILFIAFLARQTPASASEVACAFSPRGGCSDKICNFIDLSKSSLSVSAYQLTSRPISESIVRASKRGVSIIIILDRSMQKSQASGLALLIKNRIPIRLDRAEKLFHNKFIIIDSKLTITGSYNFSDNAELRNAENLVIITDESVAKAFTDNFNYHLKHSLPFLLVARWQPIAVDFFVSITLPTSKGAFEMAKLTGPLMSIAASGTFGKTIVYSIWKGRAYARERVVPSNPKSAKQLGVRAMMSFLSQAWTNLVAGEKDDYDEGALSKSISPFNEFLSQNMSAWQNSVTPSKNWPAEAASTPLTVTTQTLTGGVGMCTVQITPSGATAIWGLLIFRSTAEITAPSWANCIAAMNANGANAVTYVDTPLAAGTYHYRTAVFNDDGILGTVKADATAVVT